MLGDELGFLDKYLQNTVCRTLRIEEIVAEDNRVRLQFAVDAPIALLEARWIPRHVKVKEMVTVRLQVEAFACGVGADQNADRVLCGGRIEGALDAFAIIFTRRSLEDLDAVRRILSAFDAGE